jgi:16S rRNA (uracil1498-N3)-methyltransferase
MECLYLPDLIKGNNTIQLPKDECQHLKALRLRTGDSIMLTNGIGLGADGIIEINGTKQAQVRINHFFEEMGEIERNVTLALGILSNRERFEFALEKAIELGVKTFVPLITKHCQKNIVKHERMQAKAIAAIKQCKRARLPEIAEPISLVSFLESIPSDTQLVHATQFGNPAREFQFHSNVIMFVGPEGGFAPEEEELLTKKNASPINFGNRRLRAETAAMIGTAFACEL